MKKKITIEKNKEFQKNELEKSNIKQLNFSLMKKHLFSLMIAFSLIVGLSASAWAQIGLGDITTPASNLLPGTPANPRIYLAGSTGSLSVVEETGHEYKWNFYSGTTAGTDINLVNVGTDAMASGFNINATTGTPLTLPFTGHEVGFTWTEAAAGSFYATVTDQNTTTGCSTMRGFQMFLIGFDIVVYASAANGLEISGTSLAECGNATIYPAFFNNVALNVAGDGIRGDIMNTSGTPAPTDGLLTNVHGTDPRTTRYYTAALIFDTPASGSLVTVPVLSAKMDIEIAGTEMPAEDVYRINSKDIPEDDRNILQTLITPQAAPSAIPAIVSTVTSATTGGERHADYYFTFPVILNDRFGVTLTPTAEVNNTRIYSDAAGISTTLGQEPIAKETAANTSAPYTIHPKPATSIITAN